ncbi:MAG TPA: LamG-like jellyroll fold domain-containing protein [Opitutaceae bacterium]|nr:LamG-like jellyroll fold domain-containing protein [Opitutaceae bacterium]
MSLLPRALPAFITICSLGFVSESAAGPGAGVRWSLEDTKSVGGQAVDVWGSPKIEPSGGIRFDGKADALIVPTVPIAGWPEFTIQALFSPDRDGPHEQRFLHFEDTEGRRGLLEIRVTPDGSWYLDTFLFARESHKLALIDATKLHPGGKFYWVALTFKDGRMTHFVNGIKECEGSVQFEPMKPAGRTSLGVRQNKVSWFKGVLREFRFDPVALPAEKLEGANPL